MGGTWLARTLGVIVVSATATLATAELDSAGAQTGGDLGGQFCPAVPGAPAPRLINGFCVYNVGPVTQDQCPRGFGPVSFGPLAGCAGASNSFLSTQVLTSASQVISQEYTEIVNERVRRRREQDRLGRLQQFAGLARMEYAADLPASRRMPAELVPVVSTGPRPAIWAQAFGDYERRDLSQTVSLAQRTQTIDISTTTRTGGFVTGVDLFVQDVLSPSDALLFGLTGGYADSAIKSRGSQSEQRVSMATVGFYGAYVVGGFSLIFNAKTDSVDLRQSFVDFVGSDPFPAVVSGFNVDGRNYSLGAALSYRFDVGASGWFIEPTIGLDRTRSTFKDGSQFGLSNGSTLRGRAGALVGTLLLINENVAIQPTVGLFAYGNLDVREDIGSQLSFDFNSLNPIRTDEGKVRGELQAGLNIIMASGLSFNTRAEYRFGDDLHGGALRAGFRYQF